MRHRSRIVLIFCLLTIGARNASTEASPPASAEPSAEATALRLDQVAAGELLHRGQQGWRPLARLGVEVQLDVTGVLVHGRMVQRFENDSNDVIEALYAFPLPERGSVHALEMRIGERVIRSQVQEKQQARQTYQQARESGRKAALLEQQRPNLFTSKVANINPGELIVVELEWIDQVDIDGDRFSLRVPLAFTSRATMSPPAIDPGAAAATIEPAEWLGLEEGADPAIEPVGGASTHLRVRLEAGFPVASIDSPTHTIRPSGSAASWRVELSPQPFVADRDFELSWRPQPSDEPHGRVYVGSMQGEEYAFALLMPPSHDSVDGFGLPTETLFVLDVSGSMDGPSIEQARRAMARALERLRPEDRFNVVAFSDQLSWFESGAIHAEPDAVQRAQRWVHGLEASGGTEMLLALEAAMQAIADGRASGAPRILFVTDGAIHGESRIFNALAEGLGDTRLHTLGIGHAPNGYLMRKMARLGRGHCAFIPDLAELERRIDRFFRTIDRPVVQDVQLTWEGLDVDQAFPLRVPDLHAGIPLLVTAKLRSPAEEGRLRLEGWSRSGAVVAEAPVDGSQANPAIGIHWARSKIDALQDSLYEGAEPVSVRREVIELALRFHLVTAYTSLVAVEQTPTALDRAQRARLGHVLPRGGTLRPLLRQLGYAALLIALLALGCARRAGAA